MTKIYKVGTELTDQRNLVKWFRLAHEKYSKHLLRIGNEGKKTVIGHKVAAQTGLVKGASDLFLALPSNGYGGLWIELKRKDAKITPSNKEHFDRQISFLAAMKSVGYEGYMCFGFDEAKKVIETYLKPIEESRIVLAR